MNTYVDNRIQMCYHYVYNLIIIGVITMKRAKTTNEEQEKLQFSKSGCMIAVVVYLLIAIIIMWGVGLFDGVIQWFKDVIDPTPEGKEAVIWRYFKGLEDGNYELWEKGYLVDGGTFQHTGILWDMEESWDKDRFRDSYRYYKRKYGDDLKITYEIDDVDPMDDEQLMRFSDYLLDKYGDRIRCYTALFIPYKDVDAYEYHKVVTDQAWIYELYIEIEGEDDDTSYKSNYVVYEIDGQLFLEPMDFE